MEPTRALVWGLLSGCSYGGLGTNQLSNLLILLSCLSSCYPYSLHQLTVKELVELSGWNFELELRLLESKNKTRTQQMQEMVGSMLHQAIPVST